VLWEHAGGGKKDPNQWKENMKQLCKFNTVEDFWRNFNHIPKPSQVFFDNESGRKRVGPENKQVEEYSLFKNGIEPEWGDPLNRTGGEFFSRQFMDGDTLDMCWQNLVLGVIGETMENEGVDGFINGARVVDKSKQLPVFRLELWISTKDELVREKLKDKLVRTITHGISDPSKAVRFEWKNHS